MKAVDILHSALHKWFENNTEGWPMVIVSPAIAYELSGGHPASLKAYFTLYGVVQIQVSSTIDGIMVVTEGY